MPRKQLSKEKSDWQDGESETGPDEQRRPSLKQPSKEKSDWQDGESETGPDEQRRLKDRGKRFYNTDVTG